MRFFAALSLAAALAAITARGDDPPKSPSCALLTAAEAALLLGHEVMNGDDTGETGGSSSCAWVDETSHNLISISMQRGAALAGSSAEDVFAAQMAALASMGAVEDVPDLGAPSYLITPTGVAEGNYTLAFAKNGAVVTETVSGLEKSKTIAAAIIIAGRL